MDFTINYAIIFKSQLHANILCHGCMCVSMQVCIRVKARWQPHVSSSIDIYLSFGVSILHSSFILSDTDYSIEGEDTLSYKMETLKCTH